MINCPKILTGCLAFWLCILSAYSQTVNDSTLVYRRAGVELRPEYVFGTNEFLQGKNRLGKPISFAQSLHFTYSFRYNPGHEKYRLYGDSYLGAGMSIYSYGDSHEIGTPFALYMFQGSRLARLGRRASLNFEWNFGMSFGWHPHDLYSNPYNGGVGSRINAYINAGIYSEFVLSRRLDLIMGLSLSHFSNGNTSYPNAGINNGGAKIGLVYYTNRSQAQLPPKVEGAVDYKSFKPRLYYDLMVFGAWRHGYTEIDGMRYAIQKRYAVAGVSLAPMYAFHRKFSAGVSIDAIYDGSGNLELANPTIGSNDVVNSYDDIVRPKFSKRVSVGMAAKAEYAMPFFTISAGFGHNFIYSTGDVRGFYQTLALKLRLTERTYFNVGYNVKDFSTPNHLMLGMGYKI